MRGASALAERAFTFTQSVGVCADLAEPGYHDHWPLVKQRLLDLKIKNVRTSGRYLWKMSTGTENEKILPKIDDLAAENIKVLFFMTGDPRADLANGTTLMEKSIDTLLVGHPSRAAAVLGFEGANEWSHSAYFSPPELRPPDPFWDQNVFTYQKNLHSYLRTTIHYTGPIIAPSIWRRERAAFDKLHTAPVRVDNYCTIGNLHYYHPDSTKPTDSRGIVADTPPHYHDVNKTMLQCLQDQVSFKPGTWVTETGHPTGSGGDGGGNGLTPRECGKYTPRVIAELFRLRPSFNPTIERIFIFELVDHDTRGYGLMQFDTTAVPPAPPPPPPSPRPAYTAIKNIMTTLDDVGTYFTPQTLTFNVTGAPSTLRTLVLQKFDKRFYLLLWNDVVANGTDQPTPVTVKWTLPNGTPASSVTIKEPLNSTSVTTSGPLTQVDVTLKDHITIVEIVPTS